MQYKNSNWQLTADPALEYGQFKIAINKETLVLLIGTGQSANKNKKKLNAFRTKKLIHKALGFLKAQEANIISYNLEEFCELSKAEIQLLLNEANYEFDKYKSKKLPKAKLDALNKQLLGNEQQIILKAIQLSKDLVNETPNVATPKFLADFALGLAKSKSSNLAVTVKNRAQCQKLGLNAFLAVAQGSDLEPYLIEIEYKGNPKSNEFIGLVGKGLTYDTGGLCLKPNKYMYGMKNDMAGAACVLSTVQAASQLKLKVNLKVVVLACENGFGDNSYRPGDIVTALNGKSIEMVDTDAEGRITLADALAYISQDKKVKTIIDFATLTGSCAVTFGDAASGAFSNNTTLLNKYKKAAGKVGEPVWELPINEEFKDDLKSSVADLLQCDGRPDASIAAVFLQEFIQNKQDWLHLDIAGTAFMDEATEYFATGATGRGVWSTLEFLKD